MRAIRLCFFILVLCFGVTLGAPPQDIKVLPDSSFQDIVQAIQKEPLEANRLEVVKFAIDGDGYSVDQLMQLMILFTQENNRLEVAKRVYPQLVDNHDISSVQSQLGSTKTQNEFMDWIKAIK